MSLSDPLLSVFLIYSLSPHRQARLRIPFLQVDSANKIFLLQNKPRGPATSPLLLLVKEKSPCPIAKKGELNGPTGVLLHVDQQWLSERLPELQYPTVSTGSFELPFLKALG